MSFATPPAAFDEVTIRPCRASDHAAMVRLSHVGLFETMQPVEAAHEQFEQVYARWVDGDGTQFWVAEVRRSVVGMIGVLPQRGAVAVLSWLRVDPLWQPTAVTTLLLAAALLHCRDGGFIKVKLERQIAAFAALELLTEQRYFVDEHVSRGSPDLIELYPNLYTPLQDAALFESIWQQGGGGAVDA